MAFNQTRGVVQDGGSSARISYVTDRPRATLKAALLALLIALGDVLVWQVMPGASLAVLGLAVVAAGLGLTWPALAGRARLGIASGAILAVLPLVELVQPLSLVIALLGLSATCAALAGQRPAELVRGTVRLWWVAPAQSARDGVGAVGRLGAVRVVQGDMRGLILGWALPIALTALFALLLVGANPVLDQALSRLTTWNPPMPDMARLWFWALLAIAFWPWLVARRMQARLSARRPARATVKRAGLVNASSVARSLVAFNALFAVQTGMDALFLYGDATLPDGISPAAYAHRGAYPLLATALLAGLFAVLARPYLAGRAGLRWLMLLWLAQTLALVFASLWRLELYVDIYGLTRLRLAAYVWMGLVAAGLVIVVVQIWQDRPTGWMMLRSGALGAIVLYACAFVNFDGIVATHNLTQPVRDHPWTLCQLSEGALPALERHSGKTAVAYCANHYKGPAELFYPTDWREWGFRNWRVRRSLAAMTTPPTDITAP